MVVQSNSLVFQLVGRLSSKFKGKGLRNHLDPEIVVSVLNVLVVFSFRVFFETFLGSSVLLFLSSNIFISDGNHNPLSS